MPKTLKTKLTIVYMGLVLLIAVVGFVSVLIIALVQHSVDGMMSNNYISIQSCEPMIVALERQNAAILGYIRSGDLQYMDTIVSEDQSFTRYYNIEIRHITEKGEKRITDRILSNYTDFRNKTAYLQKIRDTSDEDAAFEYYNAAVIPVFTSLTDDLNGIIVLNQTVMLDDKINTSRGAKVSLVIVLLLSLCAVVAGFFISRHYVGRFLRPLQEMTSAVGRLKDGSFDLKLDVRANDEIGSLAREFNEMTARLNRYEQSTKGRLLSERNQSVAIMKSISDPLLVLDGNYRIVLLNDSCEAFFGVAEAKELGRHFLEAIPDGKLFDAVSDIVSGGAEGTRKTVQIERNGAQAYFTVSVTTLATGSETRHIVLLHNVTDIKELEQAKTDFVATISHEFKTPLTAVMMGASLLQSGGLGQLPPQQLEVLGTICDNSQKLADFVADLLELSRIESGKSIYSFEPCSMRAISFNSVGQYEEAARRLGVTIENTIGEDLPLVYADYEKITWVLNNLIGNAVKYTKAGDRITLEASAGPEVMSVSVTDTGEGIPPEFIDRVFEKFVQVPGDDIEARGTGLGLSVAKEIITAHHGTIGAESRLGQGSRFTFTLPLYREDNA